MQHNENELGNARESRSVTATTCCIVGGGPAGAVLALLLARKEVPVVLLEAHKDFDREFRGDTIHPSILTILAELGLIERFLQLPHTKMTNLSIRTETDRIKFADLKRLPTEYQYIAMVPQAKFLDFIIAEARRYPAFSLVMGAQVDELLYDGSKVCGVRYRGQDGYHEVSAPLTVAADGRFSRIRKLAGFEPIKTSPPMDILWFRLSRKPGDPDEAFAQVRQNVILVMLNRGEYWQMGYVISKGQYQQIRARGLDYLRQSVAQAVPELVDRVCELQDWKHVSVLSVESSRLPRWHRPGLLLIGDATHVMSPVGGVGINYAIQDAVVAANVLGEKLKYGIVQTRDLATVQRKRQVPTRLIQAFQSFVQRAIFNSVLTKRRSFTLPVWIRFLLRIPGIRNIPARIVGLGFWPVHVRQ